MLPLRFALRIFIAVLLHVLLRHQFKRDPLVGIDFFPFDHLLRHLDRFFALAYGILEHGDGQFAACQGFQAIRRGINAAHQNGFFGFAWAIAMVAPIAISSLLAATISISSPFDSQLSIKSMPSLRE